MTKAAVAMLTKTLAIEAGPHGIRVNALAPGVILTNFSSHYFVNEDGTVDDDKLAAYKKNFGAMAPVGRVGAAEDVAWMILYLVSDPASFVTGQTLRPNGGVAMPWYAPRVGVAAPVYALATPKPARKRRRRSAMRADRAALAPQAPCTPPPGWADADAR